MTSRSLPWLLPVAAALAGVLLRAGPPAAREGTVTDGQRPLAGARVRIQGECPAVESDRDGRFRLPAAPKQGQRVTAWKEGYAIAAAPAGRGPLRLRLSPLPGEDHEDYRWIDPAPDAGSAHRCGNCHRQIHDEWAGSAHARAATNRRFLDLFAGAGEQAEQRWNLLREHPLGSGVCASCHAPTYRDPELAYDLRKVSGVAARGVHCDYCHKIADAAADERGLTFGRDGYTLLRPKDGELLFFGPLDDAYREGETFAHAPLYKESRYCASCHEGVVFGVHVYGTYTEWLQSPAKHQGQQCQTCHMPPTGKMTNLAPGKGGIERNPQTLASHHTPGATPEMLKRCLQVEVRLRRTAASVTVTVEVAARNVGHRVPTGFIDRNLALVVEAFDGKGKAVAQRGGPTLPPAAGKAVRGKAGYLYAKLLRGRDGAAPSPFWLPPGEIHDTRLHPEKADRRTFAFNAEARQVRVRLVYRRFWQEVAEARRWPDDAVIVVDRTMTVDDKRRTAQ